jgi:hypothetical protein
MNKYGGSMPKEAQIEAEERMKEQLGIGRRPGRDSLTFLSSPG